MEEKMLDRDTLMEEQMGIYRTHLQCNDYGRKTNEVV